MDYKSVFVGGEWDKYNKKKMFGGEKEVETTALINTEDLAEKITAECNKLDKEGFRVFSIIPITMGVQEDNVTCAWGYSPTIGVMLTSKK